MSLLGFQRALADLAASPDRCAAAIADPVPVLRVYDLTVREHRRLAAMVRDRLMATNCVLYRANRVTPIYVFLPMTCQILGDTLRRELDHFWSRHAGVDLQYLSETIRFACFLRERLESEELSNPYLAEVVDYESAITELRFAPRDTPESRLVRFTHDPVRLLDALARRMPVPDDLECGEYRVMLDGGSESLDVRIRRVVQEPAAASYPFPQ
jgi:hypothetical protein